MARDDHYPFAIPYQSAHSTDQIGHGQVDDSLNEIGALGVVLGMGKSYRRVGQCSHSIEDQSERLYADRDDAGGGAAKRRIGR